MRLNYHTIGSQIRRFRKEKHISQASLSEQIDKSPAYISYIENGHKSMSLDTFVQIANTLEISTDILLAEHLCFPKNAIDAEIADILWACSVQEQQIIIDTVLALKQALQVNL